MLNNMFSDEKRVTTGKDMFFFGYVICLKQGMKVKLFVIFGYFFSRTNKLLIFKIYHK